MQTRLTAQILIGLFCGVLLGLGGYTFIYARGYSYLTNDPQACANCHVMEEHFSGWMKSSHRAVAVCNDCHAPHDIAGKYATKITNGFRHSLAFTSGRFPENFNMTRMNSKVTEGACRHCHEDIVNAIDGGHPRDEALSCVGCHRSVGHLH